MKYKKLSLILLLAILLSLTSSGEKALATSAPYLSLNCEKDVVTNDNAILNATLNNIAGVNIEAFEIRISSNGNEVVKYKKMVNTASKKMKLTFDINKDTKIKLQPNKKYDYVILAETKENVNLSMYTAKHHFTTQAVKVSVVDKKEKSNTAVLVVGVDNPKGECIKKIGVKILNNNKIVKDYYKTINKTDNKFEYLFDIKEDAKYTLKQKTKYSYIVYAEIDVSQEYIYSAVSECRGFIKTLGKTGIKTSVKNSKKIIKLNLKINNPSLKKILKIKVAIKNNKKRYVIYDKKINKKKKYIKSTLISINIKKARLKRIAKAKKYKYIVYVSIGNKTYKSQGKIKIN